MGDRFLSGAGTGKSCALSMRVPNPSPALDKIRALVGPEILSSTVAGVWRKAPKGFQDSSSVLDKFQSASTKEQCNHGNIILQTTLMYHSNSNL